MIEIFLKGGPLMYPILICSVIGWAIFLERVKHFYTIRRTIAPLFNEVSSLIDTQKFEEATFLCQTQKNSLAKILTVVLMNRGANRLQLKTMAEEVGSREAASLQCYLNLLATIANIAPLLGLLGTVLGMIEAFNVIAMEGVGTPMTLGGGISEALITTAAGLSVAVPMILLHRYLASRAENILLELEESSMKIVDLLGE
ncbi:biopolymer transport protein ExbB [Malonomonas rubra DSM 5091]|uniref:Biopolymer transport protein ExbB n=1 Tax=Malonomonas rubra DSM 5091 TaxID=1122189 RepID=A0A1M6B519_MALRU|nr:MotA/TolQ/ExbB proton channel family protein [Malonomonas rubra]SHI43879.1 biopolymer transport protein ExbB [Malonomonas rubra DSM 5091]